MDERVGGRDMATNECNVFECSHPYLNIVKYTKIVCSSVDRAGNLRLYRRRRLRLMADIFHPAGEWRSFTVDATGIACVELNPGEREISDGN